MAKVTGRVQFSKRLASLTTNMRVEVGKAIYAAADIVKTEAQLSIVRGSVTGKNHVPSKPGEPPNADTRQLDTNIITVKTGELTAEVQSNAPYSAALEFGTSRMAERPFMRPAAAKAKPLARALVVKAVNRVVGTK